MSTNASTDSPKKKRRRKGLLPQTKALRFLAANNWIADPAERKLGLISKDWGGFADIVAVNSIQAEVLFLQVTSRANVSSRRKKILENDNARELVGFPHLQVEVWGYDSKSTSLQPERVERIALDDFEV